MSLVLITILIATYLIPLFTKEMSTLGSIGLLGIVIGCDVIAFPSLMEFLSDFMPMRNAMLMTFCMELIIIIYHHYH